MSIDGYLDDATEERLLLSNEADFDRVDEVRAGCDAILVGAGTIRQDNPRLLVRSAQRRAARVARGEHPDPVKVTVTGSCHLDPQASFFTTGDAAKLVYCATSALDAARDRLGAVATVLAVTDFAERAAPLIWDGIDEGPGGPFDHELRSLGWPELRALAADGWEVGSHTCDHPHLTRCEDGELERQMTASRAAVERAMERPCTSIAYPYGDVDQRVAHAAGRAGYVAGATLPARWHEPTALLWPRVGIYHPDDDRRFGLKTSRVVRRLRRIVDPVLPSPRS